MRFAFRCRLLYVCTKYQVQSTNICHELILVAVTALERMGATPDGNSPKDFDAFMRAEAAKWDSMLKEANINVQ